MILLIRYRRKLKVSFASAVVGGRCDVVTPEAYTISFAPADAIKSYSVE